MLFLFNLCTSLIAIDHILLDFFIVMGNLSTCNGLYAYPL
jgi:hypothetical protein